MIYTIYVLYVIAFSLAGCSLWLKYSRDRYRESAQSLAKELVELRADPRLAKLTEGEKPLTSPKVRVQTPPKRLSGAQLRRVAERVNAADMEAMQERPNSEILKEQANG